MPSKYFPTRALPSGTKYTPAGSSKVFNDPNVDEKYKEVINQFQMSLIKTGEQMLNTFTASTVKSIPESIIPANDDITRLNDRTIPQSPKAASPQANRVSAKYLEKISKIAGLIERKTLSSKAKNGLSSRSFGKIDADSGTFYPGIIKYDENNNPFYDMRISINFTLGEIEIKIKVVK
jgi:hypothetical protein